MVAASIMNYNNIKELNTEAPSQKMSDSNWNNAQLKSYCSILEKRYRACGKFCKNVEKSLDESSKTGPNKELLSKELKSLNDDLGQIVSSQSTAGTELWEARITGSTPQSPKQPEDSHSSSVENKPDLSKQNQTNTTLNEPSPHLAPTVSQIVTKPQSIKLVGETPIFGGKASTMSIDDWLFMVETKMKLGRVPNDTKIALLSSYLKGTALQLAKHFMDSDPDNYEKFKEAMLKNYTPLDQNVEDRSAWHRLRQSDYESFEKYLEDFQFLANRLKASDESKLELLKSQLNHDFRLTLATNQTCKTLEDVIICCRKIAPFYEHKKKAHQINVVSKFQQRCRFCGKTNHKIEQCFKKRNFENRSKESSDRDRKTYNQKPYN